MCIIVIKGHVDQFVIIPNTVVYMIRNKGWDSEVGEFSLESRNFQEEIDQAISDSEVIPTES